jgi:hypothetical protein
VSAPLLREFEAVILQEILGVSVIVRHESSACAHRAGDLMDGRWAKLVRFDVGVAYFTGLSDFIESWDSRERLEYDPGFMKMRDLDEHLFMVPLDKIGSFSLQGYDVPCYLWSESFQGIGLFHGAVLLKEKGWCST